MTIVSIPQMAIFASYNSGKDFDTASFANMVSFGSLGQATTACSQVSNGSGLDSGEVKFVFTCGHDYYINGTFSAGLIQFETKDIGGNTNIQTCYESEEEQQNNPLSKNVDYTELNNQIMTQCLNKRECTPTITYAGVWTG